MPLRFGYPKIVKPSQLSISGKSFEIGSLMVPFERMNTNKNIREITQKYKGIRRRNLEIYNLIQSIFVVLPSIILKKNKKPVIMKKS